MNGEARLRVLIVYPFLHHYRYGVFSALEEDPRLEVTFAADDRGRRGIATIPTHLLQRFVRTRTTVVGRFSYQAGLPRLVSRGDFDAVIFLGDMWSVSLWRAARRARRAGAVVFFWTIGWHRPENGLLGRLRMCFYGRADELLLYGNVGKQIGIRAGYPEPQMSVIYNSHESAQQFEGEGSADLESVLGGRRPSVGAIVRLTAPKRLDLLLRAVALIQGARPRVLIAGDGPERSNLERLADELEVEVTFVGAVYTERDIERIYEHLDVTVVPCAAGLTAIQSLHHGTPVITDDDEYGQMPEAEAVIDGVTGSRYRANDVQALADAISRRLAGEELDAEDLQAVAARWAAQPHADAIVDRLFARTHGRGERR